MASTLKAAARVLVVVGLATPTLLILGQHAATAVPVEKVAICHATSSEDHPYIETEVALEGLNGHGDHAEDLISKPEGGCPGAPSAAEELTPGAVDLPATQPPPAEPAVAGGPGDDTEITPQDPQVVEVESSVHDPLPTGETPPEPADPAAPPVAEPSPENEIVIITWVDYFEPISEAFGIQEAVTGAQTQEARDPVGHQRHAQPAPSTLPDTGAPQLAIPTTAGVLLLLVGLAMIKRSRASLDR